MRISFFMNFVTLLNVALLALLIYLIVLAVRALRRYLKKDKASATDPALSVGETIRARRTACGMTQEFVAQHLGVSRQAVSKWESGTGAPSTGNLLALADLFGISAAELLPRKEQ